MFWGALLYNISTNERSSTALITCLGGHSPMAAALSWEASHGLPPEILEILGASAELLLGIPEHKVALPGGRRESQCYVFALVRENWNACGS